MKKLFLLLVSLLAISCANYEAPLCNSSNRVEVPNFEGRFSATISMITEEKSTVIKQSVVVSRLDRGLYLVQQSNENSVISTCELDGHIYAESKDKSKSAFFGSGIAGTYSSFLLERNSDGSFDLGVLGSDTSILKARGVPFRIVVTTTPKDENNPEEKKSFNLLIDNSKISPEDFVQLLDPLSLKLTWLPEAG